MGKLNNEKAAGKDEITGEMIKKREGWLTGWWTKFGGCVIWPLRIVLCQKTGDLL